MPDDVLELYREAGRRGAAEREAWAQRVEQLHAGRAGAGRGVRRLPGRAGPGRLGAEAAVVAGRRADRHPGRLRRRPQRRRRPRARPDRRRRRPHRQHRHQAVGLRGLLPGGPQGPPALLRCAGARHGVGHERDGPPRRRPPLRRDVPDLLRLHAGRRSASPPWSRPAPPSCGRTTRSASARTGRPTSRSSTSPRCGPSRACGSSGRPTPTRRRRLAGPPQLRRAERASSSPARSCRSSRGRRSGPRPASRRAPTSSSTNPATSTSSSSGRAPRCRSASRPRRPWRSSGVSARVVSMPCWELFQLLSEEEQAAVLPPGVPDPGGRGGLHARLGALRRRHHRPRPVRGLGPGGHRPGEPGFHRRERRRPGPGPARLRRAAARATPPGLRRRHRREERAAMTVPHRPAQRVRPEPLVRQHPPVAAGERRTDPDDRPRTGSGASRRTRRSSRRRSRPATSTTT